MLRSITLAAALAAAATPTLAGGFAPVVVAPEPVVVVEPEAPRSTWGILIPLLLLGALVYVATRDDEDDDPVCPPGSSYDPELDECVGEIVVIGE